MDAGSQGVGHWILGTAGHIDHGKSSLVRALTGVDPDRLPEEKLRGMTIELGFAPLRIGDRHFGIVDVPGHERFVRTMVAGATGIDVVLLVVAADDGVMPQTREHAQILDLLGITRGCVALTKTDLVPSQRVDEVRREVRSLLAGTGLAEFPIVPVSSATGAGLEELRDVLLSRVGGDSGRSAGSIFRMAIDRAFQIRGRGTVVTGSVISGQVEAGQTLELLPGGDLVKVREVQSHGRAGGVVGAGQRAALNVTGIEHGDVRRGQELATPGFIRPTCCADAAIRILADVDKAIPSHATVRICIGTTETLGRLVVFERNNVGPGERAFVQIRTPEPIAAQHGQRLILRHETATHTLGGGRILRPVSQRTAARWAENRCGLEALDSGDERQRVAEAWRRLGFDDCPDLHLACRAGVAPERIKPLQLELLEANVLLMVAGARRPIHGGVLDDLHERTHRFLQRWHEQHRNEPGFPQDRFQSWLERRIDPGERSRRGPELVRAVLAHLGERGTFQTQGRFVRHPDFAPSLSAEDRNMLELLLDKYRRAGFQPPTISELRVELGRAFPRAERMIQHALAEGMLTRIDAELLLDKPAYQGLNETVRSLIARDGPVTVGQVREALVSTRKFVVPFLEHLDRAGLTRRQGDRRVLA